MTNTYESLKANFTDKYPKVASLFSETFWLETAEDLEDTLNEEMDENTHPLFLFYFVDDGANHEKLDELENSINEDDEDEFLTTMDRFEHYIGIKAWALPISLPLEIAVAGGVDSYGYAKWEDMNADNIVVIDTFDVDGAWS